MNDTQLRVRFLTISLALALIAGLLWTLTRFGTVAIPTFWLLLCRWSALLVLATFAAVRRSLTVWIGVGILMGAEAGHDWPRIAINLQLLSAIFLRLIKTIIAPLIFSTLVVGIAGHSNLRQVGRMGIKALAYFEVITTIALFIGLGAINLSQAGAGVSAPAGAAQSVQAARQSPSDVILHIFPENIAKSVADGQVLQVVVFSVLFGIALAMVAERKRRPVLDFFEGVSETMFKFTNIVMLFAPFGVAGAIAYTVGTLGFGVLFNLLKLIASLYGALLVLILFVFVPVALLARLPLKKLFRAIAEPASIAFATASSEAALPRAMEAMERFGVPRQIVAFVMPTGYSFNLDGSTLYLSLASVFVAQAAGIHMKFTEQLLMVVTLMLTSKGVAGVPRAMLVILMATVDSFHLPNWPVLIVLGVDQIMDMARTMVNVIGNCLATAVVARWEGELNSSHDSSALSTVAQ